MWRSLRSCVISEDEQSVNIIWTGHFHFGINNTLQRLGNWYFQTGSMHAYNIMRNHWIFHLTFFKLQNIICMVSCQFKNTISPIYILQCLKRIYICAYYNKCNFAFIFNLPPSPQKIVWEERFLWTYRYSVVISPYRYSVVIPRTKWLTAGEWEIQNPPLFITTNSKYSYSLCNLHPPHKCFINCADATRPEHIKGAGMKR